MIIAVAHSRTPAGRAALDLALRESVLRGAELVVLHVVDRAESATSEAEDAVRASIAEHVPTIEGAGDVPTRIATAATRGDVAEAILGLAAEASAELLVIGSRRRSPVGRLIMGSTVQRVLLDSPVPVLVTRG